MTCCSGIGGAFVLLAFIAVVAVLLAVAAVCLVVGLVLRRRGRTARGWLRTAAAVGGVGVGAPIALAIWGAAAADPQTLRLDLRGERSVELLDTEEFPGFPDTWHLDSDQVDLRLPDGRRLRTDVVNTVFRADDGDHVSDLTVRGPAEPVPRAVRRARDWAYLLDARVDTLADHRVAQGRGWQQRTRTDHLEIEVSVQAVSGGERAIARTRVEFTD